jgi:hypothetical protein
MDITTILTDMFAVLAGPVIRVFKILAQSLSWLSIIIIVCHALCFIVINTLSGGEAIVAKIISWLLHAAYFINKLIPKNEYYAITFPKQCLPDGQISCTELEQNYRKVVYTYDMFSIKSCRML